MSIKIDEKHVRKLQKNIQLLLAAPSYPVGDMIVDPLYGKHTYQGVYWINTPDDDEIVYIGKTNDGAKENGLADRIWTHAQKESEIQSALGSGPNTFKKYKVKTLEIADPVERGLTELYGVAVLKPKANRVCRESK